MNHHDHDLDRDWAALLESLEPDAAELAAAERELQELDAVAPLPAAQIDAMVAAAVGVASVAPVVPIRSARRHVRRMLLLAALLFVALPSVAWFFRKTSLFAEPKLVLTPTEHAFGQALEICIAPEPDDATRTSALGVLLNYTAHAAQLIGDISGSENDPLRPTAEAAMHRARSEASAQDSTRPRQVPGDLVAAVVTARNEEAPIEEREAALAIAANHLLAGIRAFRVAPFSTPQGVDYQRFCTDTIRRLLGQ